MKLTVCMRNVTHRIFADLSLFWCWLRSQVISFSCCLPFFFVSPSLSLFLSAACYTLTSSCLGLENENVCISLNRYFVCISKHCLIIRNNLRLHIIIIFLYQAIITSLRRLPSKVSIMFYCGIEIGCLVTCSHGENFSFGCMCSLALARLRSFVFFFFRLLFSFGLCYCCCQCSQQAIYSKGYGLRQATCLPYCLMPLRDGIAKRNSQLFDLLKKYVVRIFQLPHTFFLCSITKRMRGKRFNWNKLMIFMMHFSAFFFS